MACWRRLPLVDVTPLFCLGGGEGRGAKGKQGEGRKKMGRER